MSLGTQCKTGAPTIEVLVHRDGQLLVREPVETGDDESCPIAAATIPGCGTE